MDERMSIWLGGAVSAGTHLLFGVILLGGATAPRARLAPSAVSIEVVEPERAPPAPPPPAKSEPERSEPRSPAPAPAPRPDGPRPLPPAPGPPAATSEPGPVDLGGLTLTNDGAGGGWSVPAGGKPAPSEVRGRPAPAVKPPPALPAVVAASDLSRRPAPPALDGALVRNYPPELRHRGIGGVAVVRVRIERDGSVRSVTVASESEPGFGEACRRTVLGSRWVAPLDRAGRPAVTIVNYTCRFRVDGG